MVPVFLSINSCSSFVEGEEISPNSPADAPLNLILPGIELSTFSSYSGQLARLSSVLIQTQDGVQFQFEDFNSYEITELDIVNEWGQIYNSAILEANTVIAKAGDANPYYRGIAKVLKAMNLGLATDLWGDVPSREAAKGLEGASGFNPAYDAQEIIIGDIQNLLSEAITDLSKPATANTFSPGADDFAFGGDAGKWVSAAHILKARYSIRLTKRTGIAAATAALVSVDAALAAGAAPQNDLNAIFGTNGNELNQWYAFNITRGGYIDMGNKFVDLLNSINDPRLNAYGSDKTKAVGALFGSEDSKAPLATFAELKFIEAEAAFRTGDLARSANALNAAILSHIKSATGADAPADYITAQASNDATTVNLDKIMTHKYIAMFTQIESYSDWRRTGIPSLTPNPLASIAGIPRRLPTPQSERLYNSNAVVTSDLLKPVWWDQ